MKPRSAQINAKTATQMSRAPVDTLRPIAHNRFLCSGVYRNSGQVAMPGRTA